MSLQQIDSEACPQALLPLQLGSFFFGGNRPRSIYQYSTMAPRLSGQNYKFFKFLLSSNSQKRPKYKENNTKYRSFTRKPRSHVRILIYRTWPIGSALSSYDKKSSLAELKLASEDSEQPSLLLSDKFSPT